MKTKKLRIAILDDLFPDLATAFRVCEFRKYFENCSGTKVYSTVLGLEKKRAEYLRLYPDDSNRIYKFVEDKKFDCDIFYTVFLNNTYNFLPTLAQNDKPFIFTLYPGGGFALNNEESDRKLNFIFSSDNFAKVIVTQKVTRNYLLSKKFCPKEKIDFIYGGTFPSDIYSKARRSGYYALSKENLDICFVAHKYTVGGLDKGYDIFIEVAKKMAAKHRNVRFHVVGEFDENDANLEGVEDLVTFYGNLQTHDFVKFYSKMDIILSPTRANVLKSGAFDGFPTGACLEAAFNGVAVFTTDPLNQNIKFIPKKEIEIITDDATLIFDRIEYYYENPTRLKLLADKGREAFLKHLNLDDQIKSRILLFESTISNLKKKKGSTDSLSFRLLKKDYLLFQINSIKKEEEQSELIKKQSQTIDNQKLVIKELTQNVKRSEYDLNEIRSSFIWKVYKLFKRFF